MNNSKFKHANGTNTMYAFACGYTEERRAGEDYAVLSKSGTWHVKGRKAGAYFWETFDYLRPARKYFNNCLTS